MIYRRRKKYAGMKRMQLYCVLYLVAWLLAPPLAHDTIYRLLAVLAAVVWLGLQIFLSQTASTNAKLSKSLTTYCIFMVAYIVSLILLQCLCYGRSLMSVLYDNITTYILLFVGYIGGIYATEKRKEDLKIIFYTALIIAVLFSITSIFRSGEFYEFTRSAGGETDAFYLSQARRAAARGIGAFGFFCFTSVFSPILLWIYLDKRKWLFLAAFIILLTGVISAGYTLALLICLAGVLFVFVTKARSAMTKVLLLILTIFLFFMWETIADELYSLLYRLTEGSFYHNKVIDVFRFILEGESGGAFEDRWNRYLVSLKSLIEYPVFGSLILEKIMASGRHSSILDHFAVYGWAIGGIWTYLIIAFPSIILTVKGENKTIKILSILALFFTALFNQYVMMMGVFYLIYPAISYILNDNVIEVNDDASIMDNVCTARSSGEDNRRNGLTKRHLDRRNR